MNPRKARAEVLDSNEEQHSPLSKLQVKNNKYQK